MLSMTFKVFCFFLLAVILVTFTSCVSDKEEIYELPTLILLSPHETTGFSSNINVDGELEVAVSATLTTCGVDRISGWRLPDEEEARSICSTYGAISNKFIAAGTTPLAMSGNYYYRKTNGGIGAFKSGYSSLTNAFVSKSSFLRPVATLKL